MPSFRNPFDRVLCLTIVIAWVMSGMPRTALAQVDTDSWDTRVFVADRCPTDPPPPAGPVIAPVILAVLSFLIPKAIDFGLSYVNQHLQEKKQEEEKKNDER